MISMYSELTRIVETERERDRATLVQVRVADAARRRRRDGSGLARVSRAIRRALGRADSPSPSQAVACARNRSTTSGGRSAAP